MVICGRPRWGGATSFSPILLLYSNTILKIPSVLFNKLFKLAQLVERVYGRQGIQVDILQGLHDAVV
jgi:hypothetical protein